MNGKIAYKIVLIKEKLNSVIFSIIIIFFIKQSSLICPKSNLLIS